MRFAIALAAVAVVLLSGCANGRSPAPNGWKPVPGAGDAWTSGSGASEQEYRYARKAFEGSLQDLASVVTIDALLRHRGAKSKGTAPLTACPGLAAVATFTLPDDSILQEGFTVRNGASVRVTYARPAGARVDSNAAAAMQEALCSRPG